MAEKQNGSLRVNFIMNIVLTMSSLVFPLITFPYVSRILLAEGNGKVQLAASVITYFVMLSQLGIPTYGIRACAVARDDRRALSKTVQELCLINLVMTVVSYGAFFGLLAAVPRLREESTLYLISSAAIVLNTIGMEWLFKALERYRYITVRSIAFKVISLIAMFLLVHQKEDYAVYAFISVLASYGSGVLNLTQLHRFVDLRPLGGYNIRRHLKPVFVFFALTCAATIYTNLDSVMLGFMTTDADVGYYGVAVKIKNILVSIVTALGAVLLPRVSYYYEQGQTEEFWKVISKALRFVVLSAVPLAAYFMLFARQSIFFLSGDTYGASVLPMIAIMPTLVFIGLTNIMGMQILVPMGRERVVLYSTVVGAVVDVIVNAFLIPSMHSLGAAIGTLAAEAAVLLVQYICLRKEVKPILGAAGLPWILTSAAVSCAVSFWIRYLPLNDFLTLVLSAAVFFGVYLLLLYRKKEPLLLETKERLLTVIKKHAAKKSRE